MGLGTVYWFTGLSGSGKTTLAKLFWQSRKQSQRPILFLDGDDLRVVFGNDLGHSTEDRKKSAMRNARLCKLIADQGMDVVCATISLFHDCHEWNRKNIANYVEIYVKVPMRVLMERDTKGIYRQAIGGNHPHVVGLDIPSEEPRNPDYVLENDGRRSAQQEIDIFLKRLGI